MLDFLKLVQVVHGTRLSQTRLGFQEVIVIDDHYDFDELVTFLAGSKSPRLVITMFFTDPLPIPGHDIVFMPLWLDVARRMLCRTSSQWITDFETKGCFNFMIYKQRPWRLLALKIIEQFGLRTDFYTSTVQNCQCNLPLDATTGLDLTTPWLTVPRWFGESQSVTYDYADHYINHLARQVFDPTAVALITEPIESGWTDRSTFTEKSIYALLSCNLPIWLGGRNQHRHWQSLGFDSFEDVIDCSYQDHPDPVRRMQLALEKNLDLLTDLDHARTTRERLLPRLLANRQQFLQHGFRDYLQTCRGQIKPRYHTAVDAYLAHIYSRPV